MQVEVCDRCGKFLELKDNHMRIEKHPVKRDGQRVIFLCPDCVQEFFLWLNKGE